MWNSIYHQLVAQCNYQFFEKMKGGNAMSLLYCVRSNVAIFVNMPSVSVNNVFAYTCYNV